MSDPAASSPGGPPPLPLPPLLTPPGVMQQAGTPQGAIPLPALGGHLPALPPGFAPAAPAAPAPLPPPLATVAPAVALPPPLPATPFSPAYPAAQAAQADGPVFQPPPELDDPNRRAGGPGWVLWAVPGLVLFMITGGVVTFLATRDGPARATANVPASPPQWTPSPQQPGGKPAGKSGGTLKLAPRRLNPGGAPSPSDLDRRPSGPDRRNAPPPGAPGTSLPQARDLDRLLKDMWQSGEANGLQFKAIRTLKARRDVDTLVQPVEIKAYATFPKTLRFLQALRTKFPSAVPASFEAAYETDDPAERSRPLPVSLTLHWHLMDESAHRDTLVRGGAVQPDVARSLIEVAAAAEGRIGLTGLSFATAAAADRGATLHPRVKLTAVAENDIDVAQFIQRLGLSGHAREVSLAGVEPAQVGDRRVRKFTLEFLVPQASDAGAATGRAPESKVLAPDPFQPPTWMRPPQRPAAPKPAARAPAEPDDEIDEKKAEALRILGKLDLQTIMVRDGKKKVCMINNQLCRIGDQVEGVTIEDITPHGVIVRRGDQRYELKK